MYTDFNRRAETLKLDKLIKPELINSTSIIKKSHQVTIDKEKLWNLFKNFFEKINGIEFKKTPESVTNLSILFFYFLRDEKFFEHANLRTDLSSPSFYKGLIIIGGYGIGKTAYMKVLEKCLKTAKFPAFQIYSTNQVTNNYESCETAHDKKYFMDDMTRGTILFDDLTSEHVASNFGKVDIMKDILEERYTQRKMTHITINYKEGYYKDVPAALANIGERYGSRVYDRIFEMFNIIVFEGKSFRR